MQDFDYDGILDLAVAIGSSGSVSVLLGEGTGGQGNGSFGPHQEYVLGADDDGDTVESVCPTVAAGLFPLSAKLMVDIPAVPLANLPVAGVPSAKLAVDISAALLANPLVARVFSAKLRANPVVFPVNPRAARVLSVKPIVDIPAVLPANPLVSGVFSANVRADCPVSVPLIHMVCPFSGISMGASFPGFIPLLRA